MATLAEEWIEEGIQQGIQKGIQQGLREGIAALIEVKFGERGLKLVFEIERIEDASRLRQIREAIKEGEEIQELEKMLYH